MSYQMIHMEVAYRLLDKFCWIKNRGDYMLGSVAPDSVHFYPEYNIYLKENSHLWNYGPRWGMTVESDKWRDNILEFWEEHKNCENRDFIAGFTVHILTDWINDRTVFAPFRERIRSVDEYDNVYTIYAHEAYGSDQWLHQQSEHTSDIMKLIAQGQPCSISGCVVDEDIECQKEHLLTKQYAGKDAVDISSYQYCTEEVTWNFINECVDVIGELLAE